MNTNAPATRAASGALASLQNLKAGLQNVQQNIHVGIDPILRMGRDGIWVYGQENVEVEPKSRWAVNPLSLRHGFICWKVIPEGSREKPELLGEALVGMFQPLPDPNSLPDYGHPWEPCLAFDVKCVSGEDEGIQVLYKTSSKGGMGASKEFIGKIMKQIDDDLNHAVPVVELLSDFYDNKKYGGRTYFPVFEIIEWVSMEGVEASEAAGDEPEPPKAAEPAKEQAPAPTGRRRAAAPQEPANEPAPEPEQAAPAAGDGERRRRRRG
jgi:hypothetical protein